MSQPAYTWNPERDQPQRVPATKVYLSGPMRGKPDNNRPAFRAAREKLRAEGYEVLCPSEASERDYSKPRTFHMRRDFEDVLKADEVCLLPGWRESEGCIAEVVVARELGLLIWEYESRKVVYNLNILACTKIPEEDDYGLEELLSAIKQVIVSEIDSRVDDVVRQERQRASGILKKMIDDTMKVIAKDG